MHRTTIMLPEELKGRAAEAASEDAISLGELIRRAVEEHLERRAAQRRDPFFADREVFRGDVPDDLSERVDDELYGW